CAGALCGALETSEPDWAACATVPPDRKTSASALTAWGMRGMEACIMFSFCNALKPRNTAARIPSEAGKPHAIGMQSEIFTSERKSGTHAGKKTADATAPSGAPLAGGIREKIEPASMAWLAPQCAACD